MPSCGRITTHPLGLCPLLHWLSTIWQTPLNKRTHTEKRLNILSIKSPVRSKFVGFWSCCDLSAYCKHWAFRLIFLVGTFASMMPRCQEQIRASLNSNLGLLVGRTTLRKVTIDAHFDLLPLKSKFLSYSRIVGSSWIAYFFFFFFFFSRLYTQHRAQRGAWTHNLEIKGWTPHWLNHPWTAYSFFYYLTFF